MTKQRVAKRGAQRRGEDDGFTCGVVRRGDVALYHQFTKPLADGLNLLEHLVAGAIATSAAVGVLHPMDTIKTFMQKAASAGESEVAHRSISIVEAVSQIVKAHGLPGLFAGVVPNVGVQGPAGAIKFSVFEILAQHFRPKVKESWHNAVDLASGAAAFVACSVVIVPGELLKQRMQAGVYGNLIAGAQEILREEGIRGFYQGYRSLLARDIPYTMLEFGLYHKIKAMFRKRMNVDKLSAQQELMAAGICGGITGFLTTPLDVAKTKLMTQAHVPKHLRYRGVADALIRIAREDGFKALFRGSSARTLWLVPFTVVFFGVHELSKRKLLDRKVLLSKHAVPASRQQRRLALS